MRATGRGRLDDLCGATSTGSVARVRSLLTHEPDRAHDIKETLLPGLGDLPQTAADCRFPARCPSRYRAAGSGPGRRAPRSMSSSMGRKRIIRLLMARGADAKGGVAVALKGAGRGFEGFPGLPLRREYASGAATASVSATVSLVPDSMLKVSGDAQRGTAGSPLPDSLVTEVRDRGGTPIPGAAVSWTVSGSDGVITSSRDQTDGRGRASARWTLGGAEGSQAVTARPPWRSSANGWRLRVRGSIREWIGDSGTGREAALSVTARRWTTT